MSVILISSDDIKFSVPVAVANCSGLVKSMIEDETDYSDPIPIMGVNAENLTKLIAFCAHFLEEPMPEIEKPIRSNVFSDIVPPWYDTFADMDHAALFQLVEAANYMDVKPLLDLICAKIASMIKDKSVEDIRSTFQIPNLCTPEEEEAFREECKWCEES